MVIISQEARIHNQCGLLTRIRVEVTGGEDGPPSVGATVNSYLCTPTWQAQASVEARVRNCSRHPHIPVGALRMQELKGEAVCVSRTVGGLRQRNPARLTSYLWQWEGLPGLLRPNGMEDTGSTGPLSMPPMPVTDLLIKTNASWSELQYVYTH